MERKNLPLFFTLTLLFFLTSCARAPVIKPTAPAPVTGPTEIYPNMPAGVLRQNISHIVGPGETLWRISKMYDVKMDDIIRANNITKPTDLTMGQALIIPKAAPVRPVVALYPSQKWKYIIIHHSATDDGNALSLFNLHLKRGFEGLGYHFIIDNGTYGKIPGQIEVSPRWIKQKDGAHCKASGMNHQGIGICLVGNFSEERLSEKQLESSVYLVNILRKYYNVPMERIMGHGQVPEARTECPGTLFPWEEFKKRLREAGN